MKIKIGIAIGLLYGVGCGYGILIEPVSITRSVSVFGSATNEAGVTQSFSKSDSSQLAGAFLGNVSGRADGSDPVIAWPAAGSQLAKASAVQDSMITADTISNTGNLYVETSIPFSGPPYGSTRAVASSIFEVTFRVLDALSYDLDFSRLFSQDAFPRETPEFTFFSPLYGSVIQGFFSGHTTGTLLPDTYTLRMNEMVFAESDPLGDLGGSDYNMALRVISVPETGSTLLMLGIGLCSFVLFRKHDLENPKLP